MKKNFDRAIHFTLVEWERYWVDNPGDPGGLTIWGFSSKYYPEVVAELKVLSREDSFIRAGELYRTLIWEPAGCDDMEWPLDIVVFDSCVIPGPTATREFLSYSKDWRDIIIRRIDWFVDRPGQVMEGWINRNVALYWVAKLMKEEG